MRDLVFYFFLLILGVSFNLTLNIVYKSNGLHKVFLQIGAKFLPRERGNSVSLNLSLVLLPTKDDSFLKKQGCKKNVFVTFCPNCFKRVPALPAKVVTFHIKVSIIEFEVISFKELV